MQNQSKREITFDTQLKTALRVLFVITVFKQSPFMCGYITYVLYTLSVLISAFVSSRSWLVFIISCVTRCSVSGIY